MKTTHKAGLVLLGALTTITAANAEYLRDSSGDVVRNNYGDCWRTAYWSMQDAIASCDAKPVMQAVVVAEPAPAEPLYEIVKMEKISLDGETYFAFDKFSLKPVARDMLDALIVNMRDAQGIERIVITGHADRIGSAQYNEKLSRQRAEAVRDYLSQGIDTPEIIQTIAMGESQPVVACEHSSRAELIRCLAPNRRVEIDVELRVAR